MRVLLALVVLATAGCAPAVRFVMERPAASARTQGLVEKVLDNGDVRVRYFVGGEGPPVLLVHGFGGSGVSTWRPQIPALLEGHTVIVPDLLWFGQSWGGGEPGLDAQADAIWSVLDREGHRQVDVVCVSYGGFVTLRLFRDQPERIGDVVMSDTPGPFFGEADERGLAERFGVQSPEDIFVPSEPEHVQRLVDLTLSKAPKLPEWSLQIVLDEEFGVHREQKLALLADLRRWRGVDLELPPGAMVVWGSDDPVFPLPIGERLAQATGGELVVIDGGRHGPSFEFPDLFNAAMLRHLDGGGAATP